MGEEREREYLGLLCTFFFIALWTVLPLYMREGYWQLGDAKYILFRNVTISCLSIWLIVEVGDLLSRKKRNRTWSILDSAMIVYFITQLLTFLASPYRALAWAGYEQWYMGFFSQLLFVGIYFFVSRCYDQKLGKVAFWIGQGSFLILVSIGILNRMRIDPLGVFAAWGNQDWESTHLLTTIGNVNWLAGFLVVTVPISVVGYLSFPATSTPRKAIVLLYLNSVMGALLLCIQPSDTGVLALGVAVVLLVLLLYQKKTPFDRLLSLGIGLMIGLWILGIWYEIRDPQQLYVWEGLGCALLEWRGWPLPAGLLLLSKMLPFRNDGWTSRRRLLLLLVLAFAGLACGMVLLPHVVALFGGGYAWGNGRGGLWTLAMKSFVSFDWLHKIVGIGQDCYGEFTTATFHTADYLQMKGPFSNSFFTNAHNEWLTQLVNTGIL
ncbi:MAG: O-antigen ligase family protein, partial [Lachnospiraceae bacterium]|nr:O-antigen ligase family protein [Lachnospiraceae bacterium]